MMSNQPGQFLNDVSISETPTGLPERARLLSLPREIRFQILSCLLVVNKDPGYLPPDSRKCISYEALHINRELRQEGLDVLQRNNSFICVVRMDPKFEQYESIYRSEAVKFCPFLIPNYLQAHVTFKTYPLPTCPPHCPCPSHDAIHCYSVSCFAYSPRTYAAFCATIYAECKHYRACDVTLGEDLNTQKLIEPLYYWRALRHVAVHFAKPGEDLKSFEAQRKLKLSLESSTRLPRMATADTLRSLFNPLLEKADEQRQAGETVKALSAYERIIALSSVGNHPIHLSPSSPPEPSIEFVWPRAARLAHRLMLRHADRGEEPSTEEAFNATSLADQVFSIAMHRDNNRTRIMMQLCRGTGHWYLGRAFERVGDARMATICYEKAMADLIVHTSLKQQVLDNVGDDARAHQADDSPEDENDDLRFRKNPDDDDDDAVVSIPDAASAIQAMIRQKLAWSDLTRDEALHVDCHVARPADRPRFESIQRRRAQGYLGWSTATLG